jgi:3-oxoacyl-[acyl-carrier protein] reductase
MTRSLTGKVALVTGAAKGIGAGIAKAMSAAGALVVVNFASDRSGAERVVADLNGAGGNAFAIQANVSVVAEMEHLVAETVARGRSCLHREQGSYASWPRRHTGRHRFSRGVSRV